LKAQSAIEYLTTYGWMLIAASIVSGVVYTQIGAVCVDSASGFQSSSVGVNNFGLTADGPELALELENERANIIKIESINVTGEEESTSTQNTAGPKNNQKHCSHRQATSDS